MALDTYYVDHHLVGEVDGREADSVAELYLLDENMTLLSTRNAREDAVLGQSVFDLYPANRVTRDELFAYLHSFPQDVLLSLCGRTPLLFVGTHFMQTGLIPVLLPPAPIRDILSHPAAFHHVPQHVCVAPSSQGRYRAWEEERFAAACRWLVEACLPYTYRALEQHSPVTPVLSLRASRLARQCGVHLDYDFIGLQYTSSADVELELATGVMLAAMMAARRLSPGRCVRMYGAMEGEPTLYLELEREEKEDAFFEFAPLLSRAASRGCTLDVVFDRERPALIFVRAVLCVAELSAQGVRERHRFLEGKSPLAVRVADAPRPIPFPELSLH